MAVLCLFNCMSCLDELSLQIRDGDSPRSMLLVFIYFLSGFGHMMLAFGLFSVLLGRYGHLRAYREKAYCTVCVLVCTCILVGGDQVVFVCNISALSSNAW